MSADQPRRLYTAGPYVTSAARWRRLIKNMSLGAKLRKLVQPSQLWGVFAALVGSQLGSGILGLVFWTIAARAVTPEQVGVGAALVAAMTLFSTFGILGVGTLLLERF